MLVLVSIDVSVNWLMTLRRKVSPYTIINQGSIAAEIKLGTETPLINGPGNERVEVVSPTRTALGRKS